MHWITAASNLYLPFYPEAYWQKLCQKRSLNQISFESKELPHRKRKKKTLLILCFNFSYLYVYNLYIYNIHNKFKPNTHSLLQMAFEINIITDTVGYSANFYLGVSNWKAPSYWVLIREQSVLSTPHLASRLTFPLSVRACYAFGESFLIACCHVLVIPMFLPPGIKFLLASFFFLGVSWFLFYDDCFNSVYVLSIIILFNLKSLR